MSMEERIYLGPTEIISDRPFTQPSLIHPDVRILRYITNQLCLIFRQEDSFPPNLSPQETKHPFVIYHEEPKGKQHRIVINQLDALRCKKRLTVVGFFGQKRPEADLGPLNPFDELLIKEIPKYQDLLSYCTLELKSGDYGNLVLFSNPNEKNRWGESKTHAHAVQLSPGYYRNVRIYNGFLTGGIAHSNSLKINTVKYFDYEHHPYWQAERVIVAQRP